MTPRSSSIPLFLWIAAALVAHAISGGGVEAVARIQEETLDLEAFSSAVRQAARNGLTPLEISMIDEDEWEINLDELETTSPPDEPQVEAEESTEEPLPVEKKKDEPKDEPDDQEETTPQPAQPSVPVDNRRIAIDQHVEDKEQEDNPNAKFAAEHAQRVEEETQARMTSRDADTSQPSQQGADASPPAEDLGNAETTEVRESEEAEGDPEELPSQPSPSTEQEQPPENSAQTESPPAAAASNSPPQQGAQQPAIEQPPQTASPELLESSEGQFSLSRPKTEAEKEEARRFHKDDAHDHKLPHSYHELLGLGSSGTTANGVNLNLSQSSASTLIGADQIAELRKKQGERRLSKHRGGWENQGLEKWRPALENYVASVKVGNTTALNAARVPFASYLNHIHQRLHLIFAQRFLGYLSRFPVDHPINNPSISTHIEIALNKKDGSIVKMGVMKSSGVTAFDVGALEAVSKAGPYGVPPDAILSDDGNVYLHWEFHRRPEYACSTYFARPKIIRGLSKAPAPVKPPKPTQEAPPNKTTPKKSNSQAAQKDVKPQKKPAAPKPRK